MTLGSLVEFNYAFKNRMWFLNMHGVATLSYLL